MLSIKEIHRSLLHLIFPHICHACGNDLPDRQTHLCLRCLASMPETSFEKFTGNPVEKRFYGRLPFLHASAQYYFTKASLMQQLVHELKYKGNKELGCQLGKMMGGSLRGSARFNADALVPLPLFPAKERKRGYNQSMVLCEGIAELMNIPVLNKVIARPSFTETQTKKGRIERWKNMEGKFILTDPGIITGKHLLLVDDVITTGATLESCGTELLKARDVSLSIACLCYSSK